MKRKLLALALIALLPNAADAGEPAAKISKRLSATKADEPVRVLILVRASAARPPLATLDRVQRVRDVYEQAKRRVATAEAAVVAELDRRGIPYRAFDIAPVIVATMSPVEMNALARRSDVARITTDPAVRLQSARRELAPMPQAKAVTPDIQAIGAPTVWGQGHTGEGLVIAGNDTGFQVTHPALRGAYRGYDTTFHIYSQDYNWHDGVRAPVRSDDANPCGYAAMVPCDDDGHGTHTMGTMVGLDGIHQIGVAPGAKWIGCRNMDRGFGSPSTYLDCFEWFLAPTDRNGANPRPDLAPHVVNNSWICPPSEGCDPEHTALLREATSLLEAAGIVVVAAAGNEGSPVANGSACYKIAWAPSNFANTLTVAATGSNGSIADFSSRGPAYDQGVMILKPDVGAPGVSVQSSTVGGGYGAMSGTSMASPHVAGAVALLMSAVPELIGEPALVRDIIRSSATPRVQIGDTVQVCGGYSGAFSPNAVYGYGFLNVPAAVAFAANEFLHRDGFE